MEEGGNLARGEEEEEGEDDMEAGGKLSQRKRGRGGRG
jgi:hypothetical protein